MKKLSIRTLGVVSYMYSSACALTLLIALINKSQDLLAWSWIFFMMTVVALGLAYISNTDKPLSTVMSVMAMIIMLPAYLLTIFIISTYSIWQKLVGGEDKCDGDFTL